MVRLVIVAVALMLFVACAGRLSEDTQRACNDVGNLYAAIAGVAEEVSESGHFRLDLEQVSFDSKPKYYEAGVIIWRLKPAYQNSSTFKNAVSAMSFDFSGPGYAFSQYNDEHKGLKVALCEIAENLKEDFSLSEPPLVEEADSSELNDFFSNALTAGKQISVDESFAFSTVRLSVARTDVLGDDRTTHFFILEFRGKTDTIDREVRDVSFRSRAAGLHEALADIAGQFEKQYPGMWEQGNAK